ncbi:hypothetical protein ASE26_18760 [Duganella sp. Root198D2]|nr:hypothetical protein ASE26_18760 [Duganella sp. Root198D2]
MFHYLYFGLVLYYIALFLASVSRYNLPGTTFGPAPDAYWTHRLNKKLTFRVTDSTKNQQELNKKLTHHNENSTRTQQKSQQPLGSLVALMQHR